MILPSAVMLTQVNICTIRLSAKVAKFSCKNLRASDTVMLTQVSISRRSFQEIPTFVGMTRCCEITNVSP